MSQTSKKSALRPVARLAVDARPSREEAESAVRTLLRWAGDDPTREGLIDTPKRVASAYEDWFSGYKEDPEEYLLRTFEEVEGYDDMIVLKDIRFESHCEHHLAPIIGRAHVGYSAQQQGRRHFQACTRGGSLCAPATGAGEDERADRATAFRRCWSRRASRS